MDRLEILESLQAAMASIDTVTAESRMNKQEILKTADPAATRTAEESLMAASLAGQLNALMLRSFDLERTWESDETKISCEMMVMPKSTATFINSCIISLMARENGETFN